MNISLNDLDKHAAWLRGSPDGVRLVRLGANLRGADLSKANLSKAYLGGANLRGADLGEANLSKAYLGGANLRGADLGEANLSKANLSKAYLSRAYLGGAYLGEANLSKAYLSKAYLGGAYLGGANLSGANLREAVGLPIATDAPARLIAAATAALQPGALDMYEWHTCETTHCLSGWAVHQAGEVGRVLEASVGNHMAGLLLLGVEAAEHFYDSNKDVTEYLEGVLAAEVNA